MSKEFPTIPVVVGLVVVVALILAYLSDTQNREIDKQKFNVCVQAGKAYHNGTCQ